MQGSGERCAPTERLGPGVASHAVAVILLAVLAKRGMAGAGDFARRLVAAWDRDLPAGIARRIGRPLADPVVPVRLVPLGPLVATTMMGMAVSTLVSMQAGKRAIPLE